MNQQTKRRIAIICILSLWILEYLNANYCNSINDGRQLHLWWIFFGLQFVALGVLFFSGGWRSGLTLLAIFLVIFMLQAVQVRLTKSRIRQAQIQIDEYQKELRRYKAECGSLPSSENGLSEIVGMKSKNCSAFTPRLKRVNPDPWGNLFYYENTGDDFILVSFGSDGVLGGICVAKDIRL